MRYCAAVDAVPCPPGVFDDDTHTDDTHTINRMFWDLLWNPSKSTVPSPHFRIMLYTRGV